MTDFKPLHVVAAMIIHEGRILACRRAAHKAAAGFWEFPGGKVDEGENSHDALVREIREELGLTCRTVSTFDTSDTTVGTQIIRLETIICQIDAFYSLQSTDHDDFRWLEVSEVRNLDWAKPDLPAVERVSALEDISDLLV